jgi:hypothetical protein
MTDASPNLIDRAFRAYVTADGCAAEQPALHACSVETLADRRYVALRNHRRTLAVYRVRGNGLLRRLRVWPIELTRCERERSVKSNRADEAAYV